jgi:DTW domain-containing protein YfiP
LCVCSTLPALRPSTHIVIMTHRVELAKTTNTGRLVARMLGEHAELVRSDAAWEPREPHASAAHSFVLFPTDDALPLEEVASEVRCLIIPDGTWAQGRRIARRHPASEPLRKVRLASALRSTYTLRRSHLENGLCTLEAVAHALQVLEGDGCAAPMLEALAGWVERALLVRAGAHDMRAACVASR